MADKLEEVLADDYLGDVETRPIDEIRAMRADCQQLELELSYVRRLSQARLDLIKAERSRRESGGDVESLVERLPEILGEQLRAPGNGRLPQQLAPGETSGRFEAELGEIIDHSQLAQLPDLDDAQIDEIAAELGRFEEGVSDARRRLFAQIDALQGELTRRYKTGEATVDTLLS